MGKETLRKVLLGSGAAMALVGGPTLARAGEESDLRAQIDQLQSRIDRLERQQAAAGEAAPADSVAGGDFSGSFKLPGSDTSIAIHGYTKLDFIYDFDAAVGDTFDSTSIPGNSSAAHNQNGSFRAHARQSRLSFETRTPTDWGQMKTYVTMDFFGPVGDSRTNNSMSPRLREAYGVLGPILAGQTYSNFADVEDLPETLDFNGAQGATPLAGDRQGQIRYTRMRGKLTLSGSIENPQPALSTTAAPSSAATTGGVATTPITSTGPVSVTGNSIATMPDLTARAQYVDDWGRLSLAGVLRRFAIDNGGDASNTAGPATNLQKDRWGGGGLVGGTINLGGLLAFLGKDQLGFSGNFGKGIGRYFQTGTGPSSDGVITSAGTTTSQLFINTNYGGQVWYRHFWTDRLRSSFIYGSQSTDWQGPVPNVAQTTGNAAETKRAQTAYANLIWSPITSVNIGIEFMWGEDYFRSPPGSDLPGGNTGDAKRLQVSMQYIF